MNDQKKEKSSSNWVPWVIFLGPFLVLIIAKLIIG